MYTPKNDDTCGNDTRLIEYHQFVKIVGQFGNRNPHPALYLMIFIKQKYIIRNENP